MATVPVPRTWTAGETVTATIMNATTGVKGALDFILSPPRCFVYQTATTNCPTSGTENVLLFDTEQYDTDTMHSTSSNTGRITATTTGLYQVQYTITFAANATGYRTVSIRKNANAVAGAGTLLNVARTNAVSGVGTIVTAAVDIPLTAGDYIELFGLQTSGGALATAAGINLSSFSARWVANS